MSNSVLEIDESSVGHAKHSGVCFASLPAASEVFKGRALMLASAVGFALMGVVTRLIPAVIGSSEKVFFRSFVGLVMLLAFQRASGVPVGRPNNVRGLVWRGIFGGSSLVLFFYSIDACGLVKATIYQFTFPIFAAIFAWLDLGEQLDGRTVAGLAVAFVGTLLTLDTSGWTPQLSLGDVAGLASGVFTGAAVTSIRKLHKTETSTWIVIAFTVASTVFPIPLMLRGFTLPSGSAAFGLVSIAVLAIVSQVLMTAGYRYISAVEGSILSLGTVPVSMILAVMLLNEHPSLRFWTGAALVFGVTVMVSARVKPPTLEAQSPQA